MIFFATLTQTWLMLSHSLCPTLCDPMNCNPPGSSVHGISQARVLDGLPFPSPGDFPDPGVKPTSPALTGRFFTTESLGKPKYTLSYIKFIKGMIHFTMVHIKIIIQGQKKKLASAAQTRVDKFFSKLNSYFMRREKANQNMDRMP